MMNKKGMLIILSGPSGSGKDTILAEVDKKEESVQLSISLTTRGPRNGEIDGVHYFFVSEEEFMNRLDNNGILEYAKYGINYYGTPKAPVDKWLDEGKNVILKIEVQGAEKIRRMYPDVVSIFLMPPSMEVLEDRLRKRESEEEEDIKRRMAIARDEIKRSGEYDYIVFNNIVEQAADDICSIIRAEGLKSKRLTKEIEEVLK